MTGRMPSWPRIAGTDMSFADLVESWQGRTATLDLDDAARQCDEFAQWCEGIVRQYADMAAWVRLLAAGFRNDPDLPMSIYVPDDEDPADTARWQKWRVS